MTGMKKTKFQATKTLVKHVGSIRSEKSLDNFQSKAKHENDSRMKQFVAILSLIFDVLLQKRS